MAEKIEKKTTSQKVNSVLEKNRKVLIVATGAIFSPTKVFQKASIPSIAHAVSLEVVE